MTEVTHTIEQSHNNEIHTFEGADFSSVKAAAKEFSATHLERFVKFSARKVITGVCMIVILTKKESPNGRS